jgi:simple sugar transport system permease protein
MTVATAVIDQAAAPASPHAGRLLCVGGRDHLRLFHSQLRGRADRLFGLNPGRATQALPVGDLVAAGAAWTLCHGGGWRCFIGFAQLARGLGRLEGLGLGVVALILVLAFLTWAARGRSLNLEGVLETAVQRATPIALAALSGVLCERSGIVNIAIEGMMLTAALVSAVVGSVSGSLWVGLGAAMLSAGLLGALLAVLSIRFKVNQIISGTAINILATGGTSYISAKFLSVYQQQLEQPRKFSNLPIPLLSRIPVVGPILFESNIIVYMLFALLIIIHIMLYYTRWGLRTRAVGEHRARRILWGSTSCASATSIPFSAACGRLGGPFWCWFGAAL